MSEFIAKLRRHLPYPNPDGIENLLGTAFGLFLLVFAILGICHGDILVCAGFAFVSLLTFKGLIYPA